jgi:hypothetical protein
MIVAGAAVLMARKKAPKASGGRLSRPPEVLPMSSYFFFEDFLAAFFAPFLAAFFVAMFSILPFRCQHRSLQHKMLQLTNV